MFFWNSLAFSMIQRMLAIWSLVPLPFLNPVWTYGSSQFMYCWSLAWTILSITFLAHEMSAIVQQFEHSLALPFFGIGMKLTFSSPVATAEFSKFAGTLSAALSQHIYIYIHTHTCWYQIGVYCMQREKRVQNNGISWLKSSKHRWHVRYHWDDWPWYEKHHSQNNCLFENCVYYVLWKVRIISPEKTM